MATKKTTKKSAKKAAKKASKKPSKKATKKATKKPSKKPAKKAAKNGTKKASGKAGGASRRGAKGVLRVRMYRIGFGDFFLLTVPTKTGPAHILIDCGVHAGNIKTMNYCVQDLVKETGRKLALVIATHYHADHLSGFASNYDEFAQFEVGMVWITNRLNPKHKTAAKFHAQITSLADQLRLKLGMRLTALGARADDAEHLGTHQAVWMMEDALGLKLGAGGEGGNEKALRLLTKGFKNKPPVHYYQGGDEPELPEVLRGAISAQLLGPAPIDSDNSFSGSDNKREQYLAAAAEGELPDTDGFTPFEKDWPALPDDYPPAAFDEYHTKEYGYGKQPGTHEDMEAVLHAAQPDALLAMAEAVDGTLNNQSLVILFEYIKTRKKLLFVGDAQWGNWSYWLYGKKVTGDDPGINKTAKEILGSIDFYKVGHHGSTNANPKPAVKALNSTCVSMCSTESADYDPTKKRPYGKIDPVNNKGTEVPRTTLMEELEKQTGNRLVRSDWIEAVMPDNAGKVPASPEAKKQLRALPRNFKPGDLYVDYIFPN
jgi:beta-lactamase superfamily II metal-dependent hydrolase